MPQSVGDIGKVPGSEELVNDDPKNPSGLTSKWETASDPGSGGSFRKSKKTTLTTSGLLGELSETLQVPSSKSAEMNSLGGISHSSSTASISTASSAQQMLLNNVPLETAPNTGPFYAGNSSNSTASLPAFLSPNGAAPVPIEQPNPSFANTPMGRSGKRPSDGSMLKSLQSYLAPTYADHDSEFHRLFDPITADPPLDRLIYVTPGAVNRELLYSGRIYISQRYICFYSGVFKSLTFVIPFTDVAKLRKEKVLRMMPTAIEIVKHDGERITFIHVSNRDILFQEMFELWQNCRGGVILSSGQVDQKVRQLYGSPQISSSPAPAAAVDIRWRNNSNEEEAVDFVQPSSVPSVNGTLSAADSETNNSPGSKGIAFDTISTSTSSVNSAGQDDGQPMFDIEEPVLTPKQLSSNKGDTLRPSNDGAVMQSSADVNKPTSEDSRSPNRSHRDASRKSLLVHSESVQGSENRLGHERLVRCRSRSTSGDRLPRSPTRLGIEESHRKSITQEPTPAPTPSPTPVTSVEVTPASIFINIPGFPPNDFAPCRQHQHSKKTVFDEEVPLPPELLATLIFGPGDSWDSLWERYGASQVEYPPWEPAIPKPDAAALQRGEMPPPMGFTSSKNGTYCLQLGWAVGPRYANITEKHIMYPETRPGVYYVMERETMAPGMPYGQDFYTVWRYCVRRLPARHLGDKIVRSHLTITGEVRYRKSIWRAFQGMIERNAQTGVDTFITLLRVVLSEECQKYAAKALAAVSAPASTAPAAGVALLETPSVRQTRAPGSSAAANIRPTVIDDSATIPDISANSHQQRRAPMAGVAAAVSSLAEETSSTPLFAHQIAPGTPLITHQLPANSRELSNQDGSVFSRLDHWLISHPQLAVRSLLTAVIILLFFTFFLARRVADVEDHLLRFGLPTTGYHQNYNFHANYHQQPNAETFNQRGSGGGAFGSTELNTVLSQLSQVAGQLSDSLSMLANVMRNQNRQAGESMPTPESGSASQVPNNIEL